MLHPTHNHRAGFSLVELAIVMVILGLLVGGIMAGQSLIRGSELQTIITDAQKYKSAAAAFKEKYMAIPGDFNDANATFGGVNGNGDGDIDLGAGANVTGELFEFWRHLQLDGQIQGRFSGLAGGSVWTVERGVNAPAGKMTNTAWAVYTNTHFVGDAAVYALDYGNYFIFGALTANWSAALTPEEAWNIDTKIDDGKPGTGNVIARFWDTCTDAASHGGVTPAHRDNANYLLSDNTVQCALHFPKAF